MTRYTNLSETQLYRKTKSDNNERHWLELEMQRLDDRELQEKVEGRPRDWSTGFQHRQPGFTNIVSSTMCRRLLRRQ